MSNSMLIMLASLLGEIVLLALVLLTIAYLRSRAQRKRDLKAVKTLIARIKNGKAEREKTILQFLEQGMGLSGEALQQAKVATLRAELGMLQRIAGVYRLRESAALARMDDDLFAAIGPYHALVAGPAEAADSDATPVDDNELEQLRKENQRLSEELTITMETMGRMLNEYSSMFAGGSPDVAASSAAAAAAAAETLSDDEVTIASVGAADEPAAADDEQATAADSTVEVDGADEVDQAEQLEAVDEVDEVEIAAAVDPDDDGATAVDSMADDIEVATVDQDAQSADDVTIAPAPAPAEVAAETEAPAEADAPPDAAADEEDEIAAILREAQSQELSARGGTEPAEDGAAGDASASADVMVADNTTPAIEGDAVADEIEDFDDLFDASGDDLADVMANGGDQDLDAPGGGEPPLTSQGGG